MKVFISWSGPLSQRVAVTLREWLRLVVPSVNPYVSAEDIDKGARWSAEIANELQESNYGVLIITKDNITEPWVNFEAGALAKTVEKARVCPLLIDLRVADIDRRSPLLQFQAAAFDQKDVLRLVQSINLSTDAAQDKVLVEKQFKKWWPELEADIGGILKHYQGAPVAAEKPKPRVELMLEELLELARTQQRQGRFQRSSQIPDQPIDSSELDALNVQQEGLVSLAANVIARVQDETLSDKVRQQAYSKLVRVRAALIKTQETMPTVDALSTLANIDLALSTFSYPNDAP